MLFRRTLLAAAALATLTACSQAPAEHDMSAMPMPDAGTYKVSSTSTVDNADYRFTIVDGGGKTVTQFEPDQTKLMHFYLIRSDLTGFQHVHPTMAADGTWTAPLTPAGPGDYRVYAAFTTGGKEQVVGQPTQVPGTATSTPLPPASASAQADGYTVSLEGEPMAGMAHSLKVTISKDGKPVTDLQPYLGTSAHLSAFHEGDLEFAHLHPESANGAELSFHAVLPKSGNYRLFVQFQTNDTLHTAALTLKVS
ncbi:hypothetical protein GCM10010174_43960 [Kutzneria viridogrisea]|uniref:Secreted protein n=1 Tax=Kutzneria viridogrisea TaxID=47990 RepID=A0ABR6BP03_9PSEU|nr:hypothetical protein [Kutzneria viridogrisea]